MKKISFWTLLAVLTAALLTVSCKKDFAPDSSGLGPHTQGFMDAGNSDEFHGYPALVNNGSSCRSCHGQSLRGDDDVAGCYGCHRTLHLDIERSHPATHQALISEANWKLARCQRCHGTDFTGGTAGSNCTTCHTTGSDQDLAGCDVCHSMPPTADGKVPFGMSPEAAGAHEAHVELAGKHCSECHPSLSSAGHPHALPADVSFNRSVIAKTLNSNPTFQHIGGSNSGNGACSNVYCHSNGRSGDLQYATIMPEWTAGGPLTCRSCHGFPPAAPHPQNATCSTCHHNVDPASDFTRPYRPNVRFVVDSLHVDGTVQF
jgi:predicted CxxxxCH...CXXCH cytochrome family protein